MRHGIFNGAAGRCTIFQKKKLLCMFKKNMWEGEDGTQIIMEQIITVILILTMPIKKGRMVKLKFVNKKNLQLVCINTHRRKKVLTGWSTFFFIW